VEGKSKAEIKISVDDLKLAAPVVAKAIIRTPLPSLGGACMFDIVNWTTERQNIVDALTKILVAGKSDVPTDIGEIVATYIGPAATMAFWGLCKSGVRPLVALHSVNENALKMLETVRERQEAKQAAESGQKPEAGPCTCGKNHAPACKGEKPAVSDGPQIGPGDLDDDDLNVYDIDDESDAPGEEPSDDTSEGKAK
jgi:hypothetical protein